MTTQMVVVCTGMGTHGRIEFQTLKVTGSEISEVTTRRGKSPIRGAGSALEDGEEIRINVPARMIVTVESSRAKNGSWRWKCPQCHRDRPLTDANLRKWIELQQSLGVSSLDISHLPR